MAKDFRYCFQHPWSRIVIAYLVTFFNFLIFAEDPVSHSQTEANVIVVGNCFSFIMTKYPGGAWNFFKVLLWLIAILVGLVAGKFLFHQRLFGQLLRLKVFRDDHGSWMTMFFSTILFLFIFSHIYNICLLIAGNMRTVLFSLTSLVVLVITTDWISWDKLNRGFLPSDEVSRAFLASFILVFDLLIVMQDWEFPHFMGDVDVNLPGLPTSHMQFKLPKFQRIFKDEYHIHITGKWFNYGIIFLVLILDLNMWKNQIFYKPAAYGQYIGPGQKIYTVEDAESLKNLNQSTLSWEWRSNNTDPYTNRSYVEGDMFLHSRYTGASLDVKCLAFIPSLLAFVLFGFFISFFGRFHKNEQGMENKDKSYKRINRKSPSEHSKEMGMTIENLQAVVEEPLCLHDATLANARTKDDEVMCCPPSTTELDHPSSLTQSQSVADIVPYEDSIS
ncbi:transmembrane protein 117 isoform X2 [Hyperolius riggenbachi]|uniref:transmembrane protein 117 isoform X2 n=1 Tax=Hyperolius riggenbachi TaxID=752182 RepID=UPI0035A39E46